MSNRAIGVFDSGMGGLTVMRALMACLPNESFVYLGDTARLPYGTKSKETVERYAVQASKALLARDVKLVVVACNTASVSLPALQAALVPLPVIGVIEPGAQAAVTAAPDGPIAVIATEGTVRGGAYERAIHALAPNADIFQQACPLFVPITEEGLTDGPIVHAIAERYLKPLMSRAHPKALLLGCTHYPVLREAIARVAGDVTLVDSAQTTAEAVAGLLNAKNLARTDSATPTHTFLATDAPERFARVGEIFLGRAIAESEVELIDLQ
ncbi:MAG TPA: glutamate racemase [Rhizomicrobium sp.]|jgi:glutamate racemase|nr:glutamate racemase [Rhizomicrobium sp.]